MFGKPLQNPSTTTPMFSSSTPTRSPSPSMNPPATDPRGTPHGQMSTTTTPTMSVNNKVYIHNEKKYIHNYEQSSPLDLTNLFYLLKEGKALPADKPYRNMLQNGLTEVLHPCSRSEVVGLHKDQLEIEYMQLAIPSEKPIIMAFWKLVIASFLSKHPYCSLKAAKELVKMHMSRNQSRYFMKSPLNASVTMLDIKPYSSAIANFHEGKINTNCALFSQILKDLQQGLQGYCGRLCVCYGLLQEGQAKELGEQCVRSSLKGLCALFSYDYDEIENLNHQLGQLAFNCIQMLYSKFPLISASLACQILLKIDHILPLLKPSHKLLKKIISFLNQLLFCSPLSYPWDQDVCSTIHKLHSRQLYPFKWCLLSSDKGSNEMFSHRKYQYFRIAGKEWVQLFIALSSRDANVKDSSEFHDMMFGLACSILEQDPEGFWRKREGAQEILNYIEDLSTDFQTDEGVNVEILSKICRLMLCSAGLNTTPSGITPSPHTKTMLREFCAVATKNEIGVQRVLELLVEEVMADSGPIVSKNKKRDDCYSYDLETVVYEFMLRVVGEVPGNLGELLGGKNEISESLIEKLTIGYGVRVLMGSKMSQIDNWVFPQIFATLNSLILNSSSRQFTCNMLARNMNSSVKQFLSLSLTTPTNIESFSSHIQLLLSLDQQTLSSEKWLNQFCLPIMWECGSGCEISMMGYVCDVLRALISARYLKGSYNKNNINKNHNHNKLNILELNQQYEGVLGFLKWALKVEESLINQYQFANVLLMQEKYPTLLSALRMIEVLLLLQIGCNNTINVPKPIAHFLCLHQQPPLHSFIFISHQRYLSLSAALVCLLTSLPTIDTILNPTARPVISTSLNILSLLLEEFRNQGIRMVDLNVYRSVFSEDHQQMYFQCDEALGRYLEEQRSLSEDPTVMNIPFFSSHMGQVMDLLSALCDGEQYRCRQLQSIVTNRIARRRSSDSESDGADHMTYREHLALSRYLPRLCEGLIHAHESDKMQILQTLEILRIVLGAITHRNNEGIEDSSLNVWRMLRTLQTSQSLASLYTSAIKTSLPFILSPSHLHISTPSYIQEYHLSFQLIFSRCSPITSLTIPHNLLLPYLQVCITQPPHYLCLLSLLTACKNSVSSSALTSLSRQLTQTIAFDMERKCSSISGDVGYTALVLMLQTWGNDDDGSGVLERLVRRQNGGHGFNYQTLLLNCCRVGQCQIEEAVSMAENSEHELEFISICNYLSRAITSKSLTQPHLLLIISLCSRILSTANAALSLKSWALTLLNLMLATTSDILIIDKIASLLFMQEVLGLFGGLLRLHSRGQVKWEMQMQMQMRGMEKGELGMSVRQKMLLLAMVKVMSSLYMLNKEYRWAERYADQGQGVQKFHVISRLLVSSLKTFVIDTRDQPQHRSREFLDELDSPSSLASQNKPQTPYESSISRVSTHFIYSYHTLDHGSWKEKRPDLHSNLHSGCHTALDIVHQHVDALILQRYLMMMEVCYSSEGLCPDSYAHGDLTDIAIELLHRLSKQSSSTSYLRAIKTIDTFIWNSQSFTTEVFSLNTLEDSLIEQPQLLSQIIELVLICCGRLKQAMDISKDRPDLLRRLHRIQEILLRQNNPRLISVMREVGIGYGNDDAF